MSKELAERVLELQTERESREIALLNTREEDRQLADLAVVLAKAYLSLLEEKEKPDLAWDELAVQVAMNVGDHDNACPRYEGNVIVFEDDAAYEHIAAAQERRTE